MGIADQNGIVVVGHRGLLGQELMTALAHLGPVVGVDKDECDILDPLRIEETLAGQNPRYLINAAAYTDVDGCEVNRDLAWAVNATGAGNLARACRPRGVAIVHLSTDFVFDGRRRRPYREDDEPNPLSVYGKSKLGGETEVRRAGGAYLIIRTSWLFGKGGKNFPDTIRARARTADSISVVSDQVGSPTYALDLARAIGLLLEREATGIVNVTNSGSCSWYEYAAFIVRTAGLPAQVKPVSSRQFPRAATRPAYSVLDHHAFERITGRPMRPWSEAVREYITTKPVPA